MKLAIILPAFNEAPTIGNVFDRLMTHVDYVLLSAMIPFHYKDLQAFCCD